MRVVAGSARGRRLTAPAGSGTRPTTDRVREAVFNALGSLGAVEGAVVLDAFAGSGALGIEALSRGAVRATFVERDRSARVVLESNLAATGLEERARVVGDDALSWLRRPGERYDLVLLDPPHATGVWSELLALVADRSAPDVVVVAESDRPVVGGSAAADPGEEPTTIVAGREGAWRVLREKRYGGTVVQMLIPLPSPGAGA